jgi:hypothetical protein
LTVLLQMNTVAITEGNSARRIHVDDYDLLGRLAQLGWLWCLMLAMVAAELLAGAAGLLFPGALLLAFFLTVAHNWRVGCCVGLPAMAVVEVLFGRHGGTLLPLVAVAVAGAHAWRKLGDRSHVLTQLFPGALIGLSYALVAQLVEGGTLLPPRLSLSLLTLVRQSAVGLLLGALGLPLLVLIVDGLARRLDFRQYHQRAYIRGGQHDD